MPSARAVWSQQRRFMILNQSGETIPPYAVIRVTGWASNGLYATVAKPTDAAEYLHAANGPLEVVTGGYGEATFDFPAFVRYNPESGSPATGELWQRVPDKWTLGKGDADKGNFPIIGAADGTIVLVGPPNCNCAVASE